MADSGARAGDPFAAVRSAAVSALARREHSVAELRRKLYRKGFERPIVERVLEQLQQERLLSDRRFVEAYVHSRSSKGFGPLRIEAELRERGIEAGLAAEGVEPDHARWQELMERVRRKRFGVPLPADYREWARQARFLQSRGFSVEAIRRLLEQDE